MNETTNMRSIRFLQNKSFDLRFHGEKDFLFLQKKNYFFFCFPGKEKNVFLHLCFQEEKGKMYSFSL